MLLYYALLSSLSNSNFACLGRETVEENAAPMRVLSLYMISLYTMILFWILFCSWKKRKEAFEGLVVSGSELYPCLLHAEKLLSSVAYLELGLAIQKKKKKKALL